MFCKDVPRWWERNIHLFKQDVVSAAELRVRKETLNPIRKPSCTTSTVEWSLLDPIPISRYCGWKQSILRKLGINLPTARFRCLCLHLLKNCSSSGKKVGWFGKCVNAWKCPDVFGSLAVFRVKHSFFGLEKNSPHRLQLKEITEPRSRQRRSFLLWMETQDAEIVATATMGSTILCFTHCCLSSLCQYGVFVRFQRIGTSHPNASHKLPNDNTENESSTNMTLTSIPNPWSVQCHTTPHVSHMYQPFGTHAPIMTITCRCAILPLFH